MGKIGLGLIGAGWISEFHLKAVQELHDRAKVVAIADIERNKAENLRKKYDLKRAFSDYRKLLDLEEIEGVIVCLPTFLHREVSIAAAERGKHILCEKPLAPTVRDCDKMIEAAERYRILLMPGHNRIFFPPHIKVKEIIDRGKIGKPIIYQGSFIGPGPFNGSLDLLKKNWRGDKKKSGGGAIIESGVHQIYTVMHFMGDIRSVTSQLTFYEELGIERGGTVTLTFTNGAIGVLTIYWGTTYHNDGETVIGTEGSIEIKGVEKQILRQAPLAIYDYTSKSWNFPSVDWNWQKSFTGLISHFIDCIQGKCEPIITSEDGRKAIQVVEAIYQSASEQRHVEIAS